MKNFDSKEPTNQSLNDLKVCGNCFKFYKWICFYCLLYEKVYIDVVTGFVRLQEQKKKTPEMYLTDFYYLITISNIFHQIYPSFYPNHELHFYIYKKTKQNNLILKNKNYKCSPDLKKNMWSNICYFPKKSKIEITDLNSDLNLKKISKYSVMKFFKSYHKENIWDLTKIEFSENQIPCQLQQVYIVTTQEDCKKLVPKNDQNRLLEENIPSTSSAQEKTKFKQKIVNSIKKLSLKRTKSSASNKSDSDGSIKFEKENKIGKWYSLHPRKNKSRDFTLPQLPTSQAKYFNNFDTYSRDNILPFSARSTNAELRNINFSFDNNLLSTPDLPSVSNSACSENIDVEKNIEHVSAHDKDLSNEKFNFAQKIFEDSKYWEKFTSHKKINRSFYKNFHKLSTNIPTNFNALLDLPLSLGLKEMLDLINHLEESEEHLKHLISKYIQNPNLEKQLLETITTYSKLHVETERKAHRLSSEMWLEQFEANQARETSLQDHLNSVIEQNRRLEEDIETLRSNNEKLYNELSKGPDSLFYFNQVHENLLSSNDNLRLKVKNMMKEIKNMETELNNVETQKQCLMNQLTNANAQIRNYKGLLQRARTNYDIEQAALTIQLTVNEQIIKDGVDASDILLEDLEALKRQLKTLPVTINWTKFKTRGNNLADLINLSRSCINELSRELQNVQTQIKFRDKDNENLQTEISKLNEGLTKLKEEDDELKNKVQNLSLFEYHLNAHVQKCNVLETELELYKKQLAVLNGQLKEEKNIVTLLRENNTALNNQLTEKNIAVSSMTSKLQDYFLENSTLKNQVEGLKKLLDESNLSVIIKELLETQEKCTLLQSKYIQLESEKNNLLEQNENFKSDHDKMVKFQQSYEEHFQQQQQNIQQLNEENSKLKEQLISEQSRRVDTNIEFVKQIEENNVLKLIHSQLNSELLKNQALEANAVNMNFETNRLAVVAEYNNLLSNQLKKVINEKDEAITNMQINIDKLSNAEALSSEDKASLCRELIEASYIQKQLQDELATEKEKVVQLSKSKEEKEKIAEIKIQELHQMLIDERQAIRELLNDHKNVTTQRNNLLDLQKVNLAQIEKLKLNENKLEVINDQKEAKCSKLEEKLKESIKDLHEAQKIIEVNEVKFKNEVDDYRKKLDEDDETIKQMRKEKEELQESIKYLKCTSQKLHDQLNNYFKIEKKYKDKIDSDEKSFSKLQKQYEEQKLNLNQTRRRNDSLQENLNDISANYNALLKEYNTFTKEAQSKEESLRTELIKNQAESVCKTKNIEELKKDLQTTKRELEDQKRKCIHFEEQIENIEQVKFELNETSIMLEESMEIQNNLRDEIDKLNQEHSTCSGKFKQYENKISELEKNLQKSEEQINNDIANYTGYIEKMRITTEKERSEMSKNMEILSSRFIELDIKHTKKCEKFKALKADYKELAESLLTALNSLIQEIITRKTVESNLNFLKTEALTLSSKLDAANVYVQELTKDVLEIKVKSDYFLENEEKLEKELKKIKDKCEDNETQSEKLENKLQDTNQQLNNLEQLQYFEEDCTVLQLANEQEFMSKTEDSLQLCESRIGSLKEQIKEGCEIIKQMKIEMSKLYQKVQILEFQKCELNLRNHEVNTMLQSERNLNATLKENNQRLLASICELQGTNSLAQSLSETVLLTMEIE